MVATENLRRVSGVYSAIHRDTGACYVGSSVDIGNRRRAHLRDSTNGGNNAFHRALRFYGPQAFDFEILERCSKEKLLGREQFYIAFLDAASLQGFNSRPKPTVPCYGHSPSEITRLRLSTSGKGKKRSAETRARMSAVQLGKTVSLETRAKISVALLGVRHSPERASRAASPRIGVKRGPYNYSPQAREKASATKRGKRLSPEHRAKIKAAGLGRKHSAETLVKIREAQQRRWQRHKEKLATLGTSANIT